jgi:hypothetical protein
VVIKPLITSINWYSARVAIRERSSKLLITMDVPAEIQKMIGPKERMELFVNGEDYPQITVETLAITGEKIIIGRQNASENMDLTVYSYSDIEGVGLEKGFMRSIIRLRVKSKGVSMDSIRLPPKIAEQALDIIKGKVCGRPGPC